MQTLQRDITDIKAEFYLVSVIVSGVDDHNLLQRILSFNVGAMQGTLWPAVSAEQVTTLVQR